MTKAAKSLFGDPNKPRQPRQKTHAGLPDRRVFVPTPEQRHIAMVFAANGARKSDIAEALRIAPDTVEKYFSADMEAGLQRTRLRLGFVIVKEGLAGNVSAARYWLQTHGGPEWQIPKSAQEPPEPFGDDVSGEEVVRFYLPENFRDEPEPEPEPPTIDGAVDTFDDTPKTGTDDA